jgi:hypothetical protein
MGISIQWDRAALIFWAVIFFVLLGYELWCLVSGDMHTPPLTRVVIRYVPFWITLPILVWLLIHFVIRYFNPAYVKGLRS